MISVVILPFILYMIVVCYFLILLINGTQLRCHCLVLFYVKITQDEVYEPLIIVADLTAKIYEIVLLFITFICRKKVG